MNSVGLNMWQSRGDLQKEQAREVLKSSLSGAREPHVNRDIRFFLEPQIDRDWILPKTSNRRSLGKSSHSKFSHCCFTVSRCSTVTGVVSQYKWLLKLLKGQVINDLWNSIKRTSSTDWITSFTLSGYAHCTKVSRNSHLFLMFWRNIPRQSQLSHLWEGPLRWSEGCSTSPVTTGWESWDC